MNRIKKFVAAALSVATVASVGVMGGGISAGASGTGAGLAEYALGAYYDGWSYVWGGTSPGAVDCSGLIWSYCGGNRTSMLSDAQANGRDWGYVSSGVPRVHGLGLSRPGHVGVYIEDGMEVDARGDEYGVCDQEIGGWNGWDCWFKLTAVSYVDNGWENFNGNYYYYENGEYIVNTSRTIDGTTYYFDAKGHSSTTPSNTSGSSSSSSSSASSNKSTSKPTVWQKGSNDDEVVKIQKRLAELGYYNGAIDGDFGDATDAAFRAFQKAAGLTVDGIAGSDREVLYSDNAPAAKAEEKVEETTAPVEEATETEETTEPVTPVVVAQNGDFSDQVAKVQTQLAALGYFNLEPTGLFGDYTEEAVKNFQLANGLEVTGIVDAQTFEALYSDAAVESQLPVEEETTEPVEETEPAAEEVIAEETEPATEAVTEPVKTTPVVAAASTNKLLNSEFASTASKSVAKANQITEKALEKSSAIVPDTQTSQVKRSADAWLWLVLVAAVLGIVSFILLMVSRKKTAKTKKPSVRSQLTSRW